jgi:predicted patatin/cPLA2 family phospholipase
MIILVIIFLIIFNPSSSQAKWGSQQDQIILLNDSAAALEDSDPKLSKELTKLANEKEKVWEAVNAKNALPQAVKQNIPELKKQIVLLKKAALAIHPTYPLMAQNLDKMIKEMDAMIEIKK